MGIKDVFGGPAGAAPIPGFNPPIITAGDIVPGNEYIIVQAQTLKCAVKDATLGVWYEAVGQPSWAKSYADNRCPLYMSGEVAYRTDQGAGNTGAIYTGYNVVTGVSVTTTLPITTPWGGYKRLVIKPGGAVGTAYLLSSTGEIWDCDLVANTAIYLGYLTWDGVLLAAGNVGYHQPRACYDAATGKLYIGRGANSGEFWHLLDIPAMTSNAIQAPIGSYYSAFEDTQFIYNDKSYYIDQYNRAQLNVYDINTGLSTTEVLPNTWGVGDNSDAYGQCNGIMYIGYSTIATGTFTGYQALYEYDTQTQTYEEVEINNNIGCYIGGTQ